MGSELFASFFFSMVGMGYFMYGRRESDAVFMLAGAGLAVYPYFVSGLGMVAGVGVVGIVLPLMLRRFWDI